MLEGSCIGHEDSRNALGASCSQRCPPRPAQSLARRPVKRIGNQSKESEAGGGDGEHKTELDAHSLTDRSNGRCLTKAGKGEDGLGQSNIDALAQQRRDRTQVLEVAAFLKSEMLLEREARCWSEINWRVSSAATLIPSSCSTPADGPSADGGRATELICRALSLSDLTSRVVQPRSAR